MLRFSCEKALLQSAIMTAGRAVAAKSSIPALEGILLEGDRVLTLSASYSMPACLAISSARCPTM